MTCERSHVFINWDSDPTHQEAKETTKEKMTNGHGKRSNFTYSQMKMTGCHFLSI